MRFAMPRQAPPGLWRRVPPAVFPPTLGLMGLALSWRAGVSQFALSPGLSGLLDGIAVALFLFCALAYATKLMRRPGVLAEELRILPGRSGVAAGVLCIYLLAGLLGAYAPGIARAVLVAGLAVHVTVLAVLLRVYAAGPAEVRRVTPVWHLNWVGFIVAARVAPSLGWTGLAALILWPALIAAIAIWAISARQLVAERVPAPLRPLLVIHLAPLSLIGTVAILTGHLWLGWIAAAAALGALILMAVRGAWITEAGFSPMWGAFTFPLAATSGLFWTLYYAAPSDGLRILAGVILIAATLAIVPTVFLVMRDWARGRLAVKTNAAIA